MITTTLHPFIYSFICSYLAQLISLPHAFTTIYLKHVINPFCTRCFKAKFCGKCFLVSPNPYFNYMCSRCKLIISARIKYTVKIKITRNAIVVTNLSGSDRPLSKKELK